VDDSSINREILQSQLTGLGLIVSLANDGESAVSAFCNAVDSATAFDLLVMDWHMPGIDGIETIRRIRTYKAGRAVPVLMLSSIAYDLPQDLLTEIGPVSRLTKPVRQSVLLRGIGKMLAEEPVLANLSYLLVDDNATNRELVVKMLGNEKCRLATAASGSAALELLNEQPFDVVLMNCQMAEMDGFETTQHLRRCEQERSRARAWVLALTANTQESDREHCLLMGMDDFLAKPFSRAQLLAKLSSHCAAVSPATRSLALTTAATAKLPPDGSVLPEFDPAAIAAIAALDPGDRRGLVGKITSMFVDDSARLLSELDLAIGRSDVQAAARAAHTLKSTAGNLGLKALAQLCAASETNARQGDLAAAQRAYAQLARSRDSAIEKLKPYVVSSVA
jgi:CheY-like chemotaxis protein/HPt (histidine-containing phosphotransfer) domain-containing protein